MAWGSDLSAEAYNTVWGFGFVRVWGLGLRTEDGGLMISGLEG